MDTCILWTGYVTPEGYGSRRWQGKPGVLVHRIAWEEANGPIPDGMTVDHLCHTAECQLGVRCPHRKCINVAHMGLATRSGNTLRGAGPTARNAVKTECKNGHPFDEANTYYRKGGGRGCRACNREHAARYYAKKASAA